MFQVRQLMAADAADYRDLRLEALEQRPEIFASSVAEDQGLPVARHVAALNENTVFGGFQRGRLEGALALSRPTFVKARHKAAIRGFYVRDGARDAGLADQLVAAAIQDAGDDVECLQVRVPVSDNEALMVFRRAGFETVGTEPRALKLDNGRYVDHYVMWRILGR